MEILTGIFVLFCAGFIIGQTLLFTRSAEPPKKESQQQVMMPRDLAQGKADKPPQERAREGQENLAQVQKQEDPGQ